jgi:hypothetical protein
MSTKRNTNRNGDDQIDCEQDRMPCGDFAQNPEISLKDRLSKVALIAANYLFRELLDLDIEPPAEHEARLSMSTRASSPNPACAAGCAARFPQAVAQALPAPSSSAACRHHT